MKRIMFVCGRWAGCSSTTLLIVTLSMVLSCQKEKIALIDEILVDYYTEREYCNTIFNSILVDSFSSSTIKKSSYNTLGDIEIHFVNARRTIWYKYIKGDSLLFPYQIVASTSTDYMKGGVEIKDFGVVKGSIIDFQIDEHYMPNSNRQTCIFSAKKK